MTYLIGTFVGGLLAILMLSIAWEKALFQRVMDDPVNGKLAAVLAAWLTASAIAGFGMANDGPYYWQAFLEYALPALAVGFLAWRRGEKLREEMVVIVRDGTNG